MSSGGFSVRSLADPSRSSQFDLHLLTAFSRSPVSVFDTKQAWDLSILSRAHDRKRFMPELPVPERVVPHLRSSSSCEESGDIVRVQARVAHAGAKFARTSKHATWDAKISQERNFALFKWIRIVERGSWDFAVSRDFLKARLVGQGAGTLFDSVSDALAAKSTATLQGRAGALLRYIYFCESEDLEPFPVREKIVYKFFHATQTRAAATFFKSVLSSMAFAKFSLGLESADFALNSVRVTGLAKKLYIGIRKLQQRPPLRVKDVLRLELICCGDIQKTSADIVMAGFTLFMVYGRARHSDAQHVCVLLFLIDTSGSLPAGFIDAEVKKTKTSLTVERKTKYLPMLAPARGVSGKNWADGWRKALEKEGIVPDGTRPLMPSPKPNGGWNAVPQLAQASGQWLRALLDDGSDDPYILGLGTHSAKATCLSWLNKRGVARDVTALLGYHATREAGVGTEIVYARDAMAHPLRELQALIDEVRAKAFRPDEMRGLMTAEERKAAGKADDADFECSSSSSEDEEAPVHDVQAEDAVIGQWDGKVSRADIPEEAVLARNITSRVIHISKEEQATTFTCGRAINATYEVCEVRPAVLFPRCKQCFRSFVAP